METPFNPPRLAIREYDAAGGVVVDPSQDRVLVLRRPGVLGPDGQPEIRLPKGHVESGEMTKHAALREVAEEAGLTDLTIWADLGQQVVEFDWGGRHVVRRERYFLMAPANHTNRQSPEAQFERLWLSWDEAEEQISFAAEKEWLRRARKAMTAQLQYVTDQDADQTDNDP